MYHELRLIPISHSRKYVAFQTGNYLDVHRNISIDTSIHPSTACDWYMPQ